MTCAHGYLPAEGGEGVFSVDTSNITFGRGALTEVGELARGLLDGRRVALFTDARVAELEPLLRARRSLERAGLDVEVFSAVRVEPTDASFQEAARFAREGRFDGYVSVGGGSVIDTCKAAILYATYPAEFLAYVNRPVGEGAPVPGPLPPHVACPTTSGTGSELTGIAVCDLPSLGAKTAIASRRLRPSFAVVDPDATATLPAEVVASSGFDVLCHALESFTARPFSARPRSEGPLVRPMSQGRNPFSDLGCREALRLGGLYLLRAVSDARDAEAREALMWAATLAGVAFGNAGVHVPHGMAYAVAGLAKGFGMPGYPGAFVPHGVSVAVSAPAAFRFTAAACPERHLEAASLLGEDVRGASRQDAGEVLALFLARLMREAGVPGSLSALGYSPSDATALARAAGAQRRLLDNAPRPLGEPELEAIFRAAMAGGALS